jgi:hypothetical protein
MKANRLFLIALLATAGVLAFAACTPRNDSGGSSPERKVVEAPIESIDILVRESFPPGYTAHITSGLPSGCAQFDKAAITGRDGDTITIRVTNTMPADDHVACTMIYGYHESNVDLGQDFVSGRAYTLKVNDQTHTFRAQ